ncbi:type I glyceraldehyde-3-phosphate dehydrogenase [Patescibacteria group bacterium]|jgi:glyceraldehyde 3-phosphate dehydrogenase|nr:type I glyceraldehyde-3-phosphate dehydrogenase [Patescibacteria group bacterium]
MRTIRVAINGFGRIGRSFFRQAFNREEIEIVAINDLGDVDNLAYLLKYDSAYGHAPFAHISVEERDGQRFLNVDGYWVHVFAERDPGALPWGAHTIDLVIESTGFFAGYEKSKPHLEAGAKRVLISAPVKDDPQEVGVPGATILLGINEGELAQCQITSNASCTTNSASPLVQILHETIGIEKAMLNTIHAYTSTQALVDSPDRSGKGDFRRGRAAAHNIIPASTGAAKAVTKVITDLEHRFDGLAMRVPVIAGSIADVTFLASRPTNVEEVNHLLREAAGNERWAQTFGVTDEPLVSSDIVGSSYASLADLSLTRVVDGDLVKVCAWYDNEAGYTASLVAHAIKSGSYEARE